MKTNKMGNSVLNMNREIKEITKEIIEHTSSYNKAERTSIISKNLRFKSHPYYTEYQTLKSLCLQILRMEEFKYGESDNEICGILFDGAWLWEEYVNTILTDHGFVHLQNKIGKGKIFLFEDIDEFGNKHKSGIRYPDFYKDDFVLDAKYKRLGSYDKVSKVDREDIHQIITYMNNLNASRGRFVSPIESKQEKIPTSHLNNSSSTLSIYGIEISMISKSYQEFCAKMVELESVFVAKLNL